MKKIISSVLLFTVISVFASGEVKHLKILTIGNSFSNSVFNDLENIVKSTPGCAITLCRANIGGASFSIHWNYHLKSEKNPSFKPYLKDNKDKNSKKYSLREALTMEKWDIITIHQSSRKSWMLSTYYPDADNLIKLIRSLAPQAEIVIQQTWSYNSAAPLYKEWKIDQKTMYDRLTGSYLALAEKYNLRIIPTGYAVQLYREELGEKLVQPDPAKFNSLRRPERPRNTDVTGNFYWKKSSGTGKYFLSIDAIHMNPQGRYLQGCVWFAFLYGKDPETIKYIPAGMKKDRAVYFRKLAKKAISGFQQVKK